MDPTSRQALTCILPDEELPRQSDCNSKPSDTKTQNSKQRTLHFIAFQSVHRWPATDSPYLFDLYGTAAATCANPNGMTLLYAAVWRHSIKVAPIGSPPIRVGRFAPSKITATKLLCRPTPWIASLDFQNWRRSHHRPTVANFIVVCMWWHQQIVGIRNYDGRLHREVCVQRR